MTHIRFAKRASLAMPPLMVAAAFWMNVAQAAPRPSTSKPPLPRKLSTGAEPRRESPVDYTSDTGETATLPRLVFRGRIIHRFLFSQGGFSEKGAPENGGVKVGVNAMGFALDFGISEHVTLGVGVPYVYSNKADFDGSAFAKSSLYARQYKRYRQEFARRLVAQGECDTLSVCEARIDRGDALPVNVDFRIPSTNEMVTIPAFLPISQALRRLIVHGAKQGPGATGVGDAEMGLRFRLFPSILRQRFRIAANLGATLPTGAGITLPQARRPVGRGVAEGSATLAADLKVARGATLSLWYGVAMAPFETRKRVSSVLHNDTLSSGKCSPPWEGNNEDGQCVPAAQSVDYARRGLAQRVGIQASASLGLVARSLRFFASTFSARYERDSVEWVDGMPEPRKNQLLLSAALGVDGLAVQPLIPVQLDLEYVHTAAATAQPAALDTFTTSLKLFF